MSEPRGKNNVHQLISPNVEVGPDAKVISLMPFIERRIESSKPYSKFYYTDWIGFINRWRGKVVRDTSPESPNYNRRRTVVGATVIAAGIALATTLGSSVVDSESSNPKPSMYLDSEFDVVSGSEELHNRVVSVQVGPSEATYYQEKENILCHFSGIEVELADASSSLSDVVTHTDGNGFTFGYGSDCFDSSTHYVNYLNPQGFGYSVHDPDTFADNMPNELRFPAEVTVVPVP